jgi:hypothetical protein
LAIHPATQRVEVFLPKINIRNNTLQTFLSYPDFKKSAQSLDNRRLNKQILECEDLIFAEYENNDKFYKNHPARKMWEGHIVSLWQYRNEMLREKKLRMGDKREYNVLKRISKETGIEKRLSVTDLMDCSSSPVLKEKYSDKHPQWFYDQDKMDRLCQSHRRALLIKDFEFYKNKFVDTLDQDINDLVIDGSKLTEYIKHTRNGDKLITASKAKQEFITKNKIYYWDVYK